MNLETLKTELARSLEAEIQSDEQVRQLAAMIDKASGPNATMSAADCSKLVASTLAVNARLHERVDAFKAEVSKFEVRAKFAAARNT